MSFRFEWDRGNLQKSVLKHGITNREAESIFDDPKKKMYLDEKHSDKEERYICIGESEFGRILFSCFTWRNGKARIIGTRIANNKNRKDYESAK